MTTWTIDEPLNRVAHDDDECTEEEDPFYDWQCVLVTRDMPGTRSRTSMFLQFPRPGIDRAAAEDIVQRVLSGLNAHVARPTSA